MDAGTFLTEVFLYALRILIESSSVVTEHLHESKSSRRIVEVWMILRNWWEVHQEYDLNGLSAEPEHLHGPEDGVHIVHQRVGMRHVLFCFYLNYKVGI